MKNKGFIGCALLILGAILAVWVIFHIGFIWRALNKISGVETCIPKGSTLDPNCSPNDPTCVVCK